MGMPMAGYGRFVRIFQMMYLHITPGLHHEEKLTIIAFEPLIHVRGKGMRQWKRRNSRSSANK